MHKHWPEFAAELGPALKELRAGAPEVMRGFGALAQAALAGTALDANSSGHRAAPLADVGRDLIRTRNRAKAQGQQMGRPLPSARRSRKRPAGGAQGATLQELANSYNVGISTIRRATRAA